MPILSIQTRKEMVSTVDYKFVRARGAIGFWGGIPLAKHSVMAERLGLGEQLSIPDRIEARLVDDAGSLCLRRGRLFFWGSSNTCRLRYPKTARRGTKRVAQAILGEEVDVEPLPV
jgi:hypothetical protein